jgi:Leucine-rich repeat (LRR) protein
LSIVVVRETGAGGAWQSSGIIGSGVDRFENSNFDSFPNTSIGYQRTNYKSMEDLPSSQPAEPPSDENFVAETLAEIVEAVESNSETIAASATESEVEDEPELPLFSHVRHSDSSFTSFDFSIIDVIDIHTQEDMECVAEFAERRKTAELQTLLNQRSGALIFNHNQKYTLSEWGCEVLAPALKQNSTVTAINLSGNKIGPRGAVALAAAIESCSQLTSLSFQTCQIEDDGAIALAAALTKSNCVSKLFLDTNRITDVGSAAIFEMLHSSQSLRHLTISQNRLTDSSATALATALQSNKSLSVLNISGCRFSIAGLTALADAMSHNQHVSNLRLSGDLVGAAAELISSIALACEV